MQKNILINWFGCPNSGKSFASAWAYVGLSQAGYRCEMSREVFREYYALNGIRQKSANAKEQQELAIELFMEQRKRLMVALGIAGEGGIVSSDCPLHLCGFYDERSETRATACDWILEKFVDQINIVIDPDFEREFLPTGRVHTAADCRGIQSRMVDFLLEHEIPFVVFRQKCEIGTPDGMARLIGLVKNAGKEDYARASL